MKKVNCIVFYNQSEPAAPCYLNNITVKCRNGAIIELYNIKNDKIDEKHKHAYTFHDMYTDVLNFLKSNNFYVKKYIEFNALWYDIDFINLTDYYEKDTKIKHFFYKHMN